MTKMKVIECSISFSYGFLANGAHDTQHNDISHNDTKHD
jgi:hypothetical protein